MTCFKGVEIHLEFGFLENARATTMNLIFLGVFWHKYVGVLYQIFSNCSNQILASLWGLFYNSDFLLKNANWQ